MNIHVDRPTACKDWTERNGFELCSSPASYRLHLIDLTTYVSRKRRIFRCGYFFNTKHYGYTGSESRRIFQLRVRTLGHASAERCVTDVCSSQARAVIKLKLDMAAKEKAEEKETYYHYTDDKGAKGIASSGVIKKSDGNADALFGPGTYLTKRPPTDSKCDIAFNNYDKRMNKVEQRVQEGKALLKVLTHYVAMHLKGAYRANETN